MIVYLAIYQIILRGVGCLVPHHPLLASVGKHLAQTYLMQPLACGDQWPRAGFPTLLQYVATLTHKHPTAKSS